MKFVAISLGILASLSYIGSVDAKPTVEYCSYYISLQMTNLYQTGTTGSFISRCSQDYFRKGISAGFINFSTARGDALEVIKTFQKSSNYAGEFDQYIDVLEKYANTGSGSTEGLDGYCNAWKKACENPDFFSAQSQVNYSWYSKRSKQYADMFGLKYGISRAVLYDTAVSNDVYTNGTCLGLVLAATNAQFSRNTYGNSGSTLKINGYDVDEMIWLARLLEMRLAMNDEWDVQNVNAFLDAIDQGEYDWYPSFNNFLGPGGKRYNLNCNALM
ncbi:hypothetical protein IWW36_003561 [Coemansia brasiliensis]|uniref:Chitosanase n=1 Tax=Coemansia brasiliensis TaxID=2650707 RepID=A0A9W8I576_9FUNG|nr:hypothetical protein IWW36_003561 [Coemansia brasiliensis]